MASFTESYGNWDFQNYHVQQSLKGGQFVSAETTLVAAGFPSLASTSGGGVEGAGGSAANPSTVLPIGLLESVAIQQNKQLQRVFEIGSSRSYFIPGRTIGSLSIGRTFYFGPSLLRALYAYYSSTGNGIDIGTTGDDTKIIGNIEYPAPTNYLLDGAPPTGLHQVKRSPGDDYFYIDLASDLFSQPTGMAIYFKDYASNAVGAFYLNECYVQGHQMTISSGSVLVMEGVSLQFDSITPIKMMA